jgi:hypothetical protein
MDVLMVLFCIYQKLMKKPENERYDSLSLAKISKQALRKMPYLDTISLRLSVT